MERGHFYIFTCLGSEVFEMLCRDSEDQNSLRIIERRQWTKDFGKRLL